MLLQPWNWILGGGYISVLGKRWIGVRHTVFLAIKCEVLYLNENIMFRLNFVDYSKYMFSHKFCSLRVFFMERPHSGHLLLLNTGHVRTAYRWLSERLQYLQCVRNGDTEVLR